MTQTLLSLDGVTKAYPGVVANDNVALQIRHGAVHALLGENGAGKTTLMNILFGQYTADSGTVRVFGDTLPSGNSRAALDAGVGMVHQHFTLADNLTVADRVVITAGSAVAKSIKEPGIYSSGMPVLPVKKWRKVLARFHHLDDLAKKQALITLSTRRKFSVLSPS